VTRATPVIPYGNVAANKGRLFSASAHRNEMAAGATNWVLITTPPTTGRYIYLHALDVFTSGIQARVDVFEAPFKVDTDSAFPIVPTNRNRHGYPMPASLSLLMGVDPQPTGDGLNVATADDSANTFSIADDVGIHFPIGSAFLVAGSSGNDGLYRVVDVEFDDPNTVITVVSVADGTNDGEIFPLGEVIDSVRLGGAGAAIVAPLALKPDTEYLLAIHNESSIAVDISAWALWSEEPRAEGG